MENEQKWQSDPTCLLICCFPLSSFLTATTPINVSQLSQGAFLLLPAHHTALPAACDCTCLLHFCWQPEIPPCPTFLQELAPAGSPNHPEPPMQRRRTRWPRLHSLFPVLPPCFFLCCSSSTLFPCVSGLHLPANSPLCRRDSWGCQLQLQCLHTS